jgi:hypothetical protein
LKNCGIGLQNVSYERFHLLYILERPELLPGPESQGAASFSLLDPEPEPHQYLQVFEDFNYISLRKALNWSFIP